MMRCLALTLCLFLLTTDFTTNADQSKDFGNFSIHYSAFTTDTLTPDIAMVYNMIHSKNRALLNIFV
jgi:hypothetical protein